MSLKKYFKLLIYSTLLFSFVFTFLISFFSYRMLLPSLKKVSNKVTYSKHIRILKEQHNSIKNFIQFNEVLLLKSAKNKLKEEVNFAYQIAYKIFSENINGNEKIAQAKIINLLRSLKFNKGRGYYFIVDTDGNRIMYPLNPKKEGENILDLKDAQGKLFIKKMIRLVLIKRSGFYEYVRPHPLKKDKFYRKISYLRLFEPYDWIIGAGEYYVDLMEQIKKDVIDRLKLFILPEGIGLVIVNKNKILLKNNLPDFSLPDKLFSGLIDKGRYIYDITFLPQLKWYLITIFDKESVVREASAISEKISKLIKVIVAIIFVGIIIILLIQSFFFNKLGNLVYKEFSKFVKFLRKTPETFKKIDLDSLQFDEFKYLARYANEMSAALEDLFNKLKQEKNYLEIVTENSGVGLAIIDQDKKIEFCNSTFEELLNFSKADFNEEFFKLFKLKDCVGKCGVFDENCKISYVFKNKKPFISQRDSIIIHDGREIPVFYIVNPIVENNEVIKLVIIIHDISEQRKIRKELFRLKRAIEHAPISIVITDINGTIEFVNPFFCKVTGYSLKEAIGNNPRILKTKYNEKLHGGLWDTILSGKVWTGEFLNKKKNGDFYWEKAIIAPVFDEQNKIINFVAVKQDVTELKKLQKKLLKEKEKAEAANKIKSEFLASMSHEIRTPMNAILGFIDLFYDTELTETQKNYLDIIKSSSENLLRILNDILDLSKLEAGKMDFESITFNIKELVANSINIFSKKAGEKGLSLKYKIDNNVPLFLKGDITRISQIINNLLSNAIKFTDKGEVGVIVELKEIKDKTAEILITVYDTGKGIPEDKVKTIFEAFSQADSTIARKFGGTGLGLAIISKIVAAYNGKIWVESEVGKGSKFFVTLKLPVSKEYTSKKGIEKTFTNLTFENAKVLIAEDNPTNQILINEIFKRFNIYVDMAENGLIALKKLAENHYDLIFFDWHMPEMDGIEAIKILRKVEKGELVKNKLLEKETITKLANRKYIVVALTAAVMSDDKKVLSDAGFDDFLSKPIIKEELLRVLKKYLKPVHDDFIYEDLSNLKDFLDNNESLMKQLLESFKNSFKENIEKMEQSLSIQDFDTIKFSAHAIKGAAYNIKLDIIGKLAEEIEKQALEKNITKIEKLISQIKNVKF